MYTVLIKSCCSINISIPLSRISNVFSPSWKRNLDGDTHLIVDYSTTNVSKGKRKRWMNFRGIIDQGFDKGALSETMAAPRPSNKLEKSITYYVVSMHGTEEGGRKERKRERERKGGRKHVALSRHRRRRDGARSCRCVSYCQIRIYVKARTRCVCPCIYASHYYAPVMPSIRRDPFISEPCILENSNPRLIMNYSYS